MQVTKPVVIDLFAGAGGFGLGFKMAGFSVPIALEVDPWACDTLRYNNPNMMIIQSDIREFTTASSIREICPFPPDIIIGGPPCQGFSVAGPSKKDPNDPRNSLFINFAQWVEYLEPKAFIIENVKGIIYRKNDAREQVIQIIKNKFLELGYSVEIWVLNAAEFGVPQMRERVFIVGHRTEFLLGEPRKTHSVNLSDSTYIQLSIFNKHLSLTPTLWDAISDLPLLNAREGKEEQAYISTPQTAYQIWVRQNNDVLYNHVAMNHSSRLVERFKNIKWGESSADVPDEFGARSRNGNGKLSGIKYDQNNRRLNPYKPSHTITASFYANFLHPYQHRNLTAREGARIQSFPDYYRFMGKKTVVSHKLLQREQRFDEKFLCQYNQIGNAVPPLLAKSIALHLQEKLNLCPPIYETL